jgi:hypothetical protein
MVAIQPNANAPAKEFVVNDLRHYDAIDPAGSDTEPVEGPDGSWDTHRNNFPMLRDWRCPVFDRAISALLDDLHNRGLLDTTLVVAIGEFDQAHQILAGLGGAGRVRGRA